MLAAQIRREQANLDGIEARDSGTDEHVPVVRVHQADPNQDMEVGWPAQGAAADCGGGESEQVGDRSRADRCGPIEPNVWIGGRVADAVRRVPIPWDGVDYRSLSRRGADGTSDSTRGRRWFHNGGRRCRGVPGRCRVLIHVNVISDIAKQRQ